MFWNTLRYPIFALPLSLLMVLTPMRLTSGVVVVVDGDHGGILAIPFLHPAASAVVAIVTVKVSSSSSMSSSVRGIAMLRLLVPLGMVTGESMDITSAASAVDEPPNPAVIVNATPALGASSLKVMARKALAPSAARALSVMEKVLVCAATGAAARRNRAPTSSARTGRRRKRRARARLVRASGLRGGA